MTVCERCCMWSLVVILFINIYFLQEECSCPVQAQQTCRSQIWEMDKYCEQQYSVVQCGRWAVCCTLHTGMLSLSANRHNCVKHYSRFLYTMVRDSSCWHFLFVSGSKSLSWLSGQTSSFSGYKQFKHFSLSDHLCPHRYHHRVFKGKF